MTNPIIKRNHVQITALPKEGLGSSVRPLGGDQPCQGQKGVRLLNDGGDVRAIEFTCACGEVTVLELQYPEDSANSSAS